MRWYAEFPRKLGMHVAMVLSLSSIEGTVLSDPCQLNAKWEKYVECSGICVAQVRNLQDAEKKLRVKMRESESELDILKRRYMFSNMIAVLIWIFKGCVC